jgi:AbrB family looped-hinge helix DNA binding protein
MTEYKRKVGDRGQVTIPKELRDSRGIEGGDEIEFVEVNDEYLIKQQTDEERVEDTGSELSAPGDWPKRWKRRRQKRRSVSGTRPTGTSNSWSGDSWRYAAETSSLSN